MASDPRVWAVLEPRGRWTETCEVYCAACRLRVIAPDCALAQAIAAEHDQTVHGEAGARASG